MNNEYYVTCARCNVTFTGMQPDADLVYKTHEQTAHNYMTGESFYDRFERLLSDGNPEDFDDNTMIRVSQARDAARKTANL